MSYNGWPNRETWNIMLWLDNDEDMYRAYRGAVEAFRNLGRTLCGRDAELIAVNAIGAATPDGIRLDSPKIKWGAIARAMREE